MTMLGVDLMPKLPAHAVDKLRRLDFDAEQKPPSAECIAWLQQLAKTDCPEMLWARELVALVERDKWFRDIHRAGMHDLALAARVRANADAQTKQLQDKRRRFDKQKLKHQEELARGETVPRSLHEEIVKEIAQAHDKLQAELRAIQRQLQEGNFVPMDKHLSMLTDGDALKKLVAAGEIQTTEEFMAKLAELTKHGRDPSP